MDLTSKIFQGDERACYRLRELYRTFGYERYKVSKFEAYDLYARNKSFLVSENILTFTDTNGQLMALKPDVTLSIVKNMGDVAGETKKVCYNETVYRPSGSGEGFREIMQTGLECVGEIDGYVTGEVVMLAEKSLSLISPDHVLALSHMGFLAGLLESAGFEEEDAREMLRLVGMKNLSAVESLCREKEISEEDTRAILTLTGIYEPLDSASRLLAPLVKGEKMEQSFEELGALAESLRAAGVSEKIFVDFSIVNDMNYYNGIMFRGYVNGIPEGILSGGRYDSLLARMGKKSGAIGFAVYLNLLERFESVSEPYEVDTVLLYGEDAPLCRLNAAVAELVGEGVSVRAVRGESTSVRCRRLMRLCEEGVRTLEERD